MEGVQNPSKKSNLLNMLSINSSHFPDWESKEKYGNKNCIILIRKSQLSDAQDEGHRPDRLRLIRRMLAPTTTVYNITITNFVAFAIGMVGLGGES